MITAKSGIKDKKYEDGARTPKPHMEPVLCPLCRGNMFINDQTCPKCLGEGEIDASEYGRK
jgi:DnaJ-class molecular chaperone